MAGRLRYPEVAPEGYAALSAFGHYVNAGTALEPVLLGLVYLRASVLNGCRFCTELHRAELRKHHEPETRIEAVSSAPAGEAFTPREQTALRWTEVITRLGEAGAADEEFAAVSRFFQGKDLVDLTFAIANINAWNRMGVAFQPEWRPRPAVAQQNGAAARGESAVLAGDRVTKSSEEARATSAPAAGPEAESGTAAASDDEGKVGKD